jgi:phospholipid transport system transporter-binding protein
VSDTSIQALDDGRYTISGPMTFSTAASLLRQSRQAFGERAGREPIELDLAQVTSADSAGLALLIEWASWTRRGSAGIRFLHMPEQLCAIARLSEAEDLLTLEEAPDLAEGTTDS